MIVGTGCDIIAVERIKRAIKRNEHFTAKLFTAAEIAYCNAKVDAGQSFAARFAAKESVMKALGTGWDGKVNWLDIEIVNDKFGKPYVILSGGAKDLAEELQVKNILLSISHEREYAISFVVLETA